MNYDNSDVICEPSYLKEIVSSNCFNTIHLIDSAMFVSLNLKRVNLTSTTLQPGIWCLPLQLLVETNPLHSCRDVLSVCAPQLPQDSGGGGGSPL